MRLRRVDPVQQWTRAAFLILCDQRLSTRAWFLVAPKITAGVEMFTIEWWF
jgi:hypothetical protein